MQGPIPIPVVKSQWSCAGKNADMNATNPSSSDARAGRCFYPSNSATSRMGGEFGGLGMRNRVAVGES